MQNMLFCMEKSAKIKYIHKCFMKKNFLLTFYLQSTGNKVSFFPIVYD